MDNFNLSSFAYGYLLGLTLGIITTAWILSKKYQKNIVHHIEGDTENFIPLFDGSVVGKNMQEGMYIFKTDKPTGINVGRRVVKLHSDKDNYIYLESCEALTYVDSSAYVTYKRIEKGE